MYSLGLFEKMLRRGFNTMFTRGAKESNKRVLHNVLKMTILGPCVEIPPSTCRLNLFSLRIQQNLPVLDLKCTVWAFLENANTWIQHNVH